MKAKLISTKNWLIEPAGTLPISARRQSKLLAWILLFILLSSLAIFLIVWLFNPHHDPDRNQYLILIGGLTAFFAFAYGLNRSGRYRAAAYMLVFSAAMAPWLALASDPSVIQGDFVPLTYITFSVLLSSILLSTTTTIALAAFQFAGLAVVLLVSPATPGFNWFSYLAYVFLTSVFSILANSLIQSSMQQIESQAQQLTISEARLRELSVRDYLTNLYNRRYLEEMLTRELQRAGRTQHPLSVIMLDVDHFKYINDSFGHPTGDLVLQEISKFLVGQVRLSDTVCRYGGDEFVLILPDICRDTARARAEQLRQAAQIRFAAHARLPSNLVTLSLGVAVYPDDGETGERLLASADAALLQAKRQGSNRVVISTPNSNREQVTTSMKD